MTGFFPKYSGELHVAPGLVLEDEVERDLSAELLVEADVLRRRGRRSGRGLRSRSTSGRSRESRRGEEHAAAARRAETRRVISRPLRQPGRASGPVSNRQTPLGDDLDGAVDRDLGDRLLPVDPAPRREDGVFRSSGEPRSSTPGGPSSRGSGGSGVSRAPASGGGRRLAPGDLAPQEREERPHRDEAGGDEDEEERREAPGRPCS